MENGNIGYFIFGALLSLIVVVLGIYWVWFMIAGYIWLNYHKTVKKDLQPLLTQTEKIFVTAVQHKSYFGLVHVAVVISNKRIIFYSRNSILGQPSISDMRLSDQINITYQETSSFIENFIGLGKATIGIQSPTKSQVIDSLFKNDAQRIKRRVDSIKHS